MKEPYNNFSNEALQNALYLGDNKAFDEIYNRFSNSLYRYAFRLFNDDKICEDIIQEVFIDLWEKGSNTKIHNLEGYLFKAVKYKISSHIRNLKFTTSHVEVLESISISPNIEQHLEHQELEKEIKDAVNLLSPKCKKVFVLSRYDNLSNNEISKQLNISKRTVEKHISEALKTLKTSVKTSRFALFVTTMFL